MNYASKDPSKQLLHSFFPIPRPEIIQNVASPRGDKIGAQWVDSGANGEPEGSQMESNGAPRGAAGTEARGHGIGGNRGGARPSRLGEAAAHEIA